MNTVQARDFVNDVIPEVISDAPLINEDVTNLSDVGDTFTNARANDQFVRGLINHIGKVKVDNRLYTGNMVKLLRESWEYGSVVQKIRTKMPEADINEHYELIDGQSYPDDIFYGTQVRTKFWNKSLTVRYPRSISSDLLEESFSNGSQLASFLTSLTSTVDNIETLTLEKFAKIALTRFMGELLYAFDPSGDYSGKTSDRVRNLYYEYTLENPDTALTADNCQNDPDYQRFAVEEIMTSIANLRGMNVSYNNNPEFPTFTAGDYLNVIILDRFRRKVEMHLGADTFHNEFVALPGSESIDFWQAPGKATEENHNLSHTWADASKIDVTIGEHNIVCKNILCTMFDKEACGIWQERRKVTTKYNANGDFINYYYNIYLRIWNDLHENFIMFINA